MDRADALLGGLLRASDRIGAREARLLGAAVLVVLGAICVVRSAGGDSDLDGFHLAGRAILEGGDFTRITPRYPPTFKVLMAPLAATPVWLAAAIWTALTYAATAATPTLLARLGGPPPREQLLAWIAIAPFAADNVILGQSAPVLLFLVALGLVLAKEGKEAAGGAAVALAALMKVIPAAFAAVPLLLGGARRTLAGLAAGISLGCALTAGVLGPARAAHGFTEWRAEMRRQSPRALLAARRSLRYNNQALWATLQRTFTDAGDRRAKGAVRLASWPRGVAWGAYYGTLAAMAAAGLACALRCRARRAERDWLGLFALVAVGMLAVSPIAWTHYFYWLLPALAFLSARRGVVLAAAVLGTLALASTSLRALGFHMAGALLLFGMVARELWREPTGEAVSDQFTL